MGKYSIRELEQLSGIKAHTIRIWEKRHNIIEPQRTATNIRFYSDDDLKKIINVSVLNNSGLKISKIAEMTADELNARVVQLSSENNEAGISMERLVTSMIDLDEQSFEILLSEITSRFGFERAVVEVIYPFLEKIGILWQTGNITPAQEHFISNLIRQKIIVAIDSLPIPPKTARRAVLFLPENELHELGLLFYHYLARKKGLKTYYLGQHLPFHDLVSICAVHQPQILITSMVTAQKAGVTDAFLKRLVETFPNKLILASGLALGGQTTEFTNLRIFRNALEFNNLID